MRMYRCPSPRHAVILAVVLSAALAAAEPLIEASVVAYDRTPLPPAAVAHPCGLYREADLARARENLRRHEWARAVLSEFREAAAFWMAVPDADLTFWIPDLTPNRTLFCPRCNANWDYAWKGLPGDRIECTRCALVLPSDEYPENGREALVDPLGRTVEYAFHEGSKGRRYRISGRLRYQRILKLASIGSLGKVNALTGERAYAEKAVKVMRRLAEVYPGYIPHDWLRFYRDYSNLQSGKLSGWKLHDAGVFAQVALCYDLIYTSGCLTEADKVLIENGAFREAARLFTATSPRGCCINDGPAAMTCGAWLGVILGDHETVRWAVSPPDGFLGFVHKYFFRDGHWEDGSPSYENMALGPLYGCPEILQGYVDPPTYAGPDRFDGLDLRQDPILRRIYTAQLHILMPDGTAPAINDSAVGTRFSSQHVETNLHWYPTEENRRILANVTGGAFTAGGEYALFRRDPEASLDGVAPLDPAASSLVRPGLGLAILRAGAGAEAAALYLDYGPYCSGHGHPDRLNIIYYDGGAERVTDQGYLGARHEFTPWNHATLCHNLVLVDKAPQRRAGGQLLAFAPGETVQAIAAEAAGVYAQTTRYERRLALVDHGPGRRYVVDAFRVSGGETHDFALHGAGQAFQADGPAWAAFEGTVVSREAGGKWVRQARHAPWDEPLRSFWREGDQGLCLDLLGATGTTLFDLTTPGLRHRRNPWEKRDLRVLLARRAGPSSAFVSVLQATGAAEPGFTVSAVPARSDSGEVHAVRIDGHGIKDLMVIGEAASAAGETACGDLRFRGEQAFVSRGPAGEVLWLLNGSAAQSGDLALRAHPPVTATVTAVAIADASIDLDAALPATADLAGRLILVNGLTDGACTIAATAPLPQGGTRVRLADDPLCRLEAGQRVTLPTWAMLRRRPDGTLERHGDLVP